MVHTVNRFIADLSLSIKDEKNNTGCGFKKLGLSTADQTEDEVERTQ